MSLKVGIIGLANVGKSTLFNSLVGQKKAEVSDYPFCTIEPNKGVVEIPDRKLDQVAEVLGLENIIHAPLEFVDIAGLIKGAHKGEGLGNDFLSHIGEVDLLCQVLPYYKKDEEPKNHRDTVMMELILKDIDNINKLMESGDLDDKEKEVLEEVRSNLNDNQPVNKQKLDQEKIVAIKRFNLLTNKIIFYVANLNENDLGSNDLSIPTKYIKISAKTEEDFIDLKPEETEEYRQLLEIEDLALDQIIRKAYQLLGLISFYTIKPEVSQIQAWPIKKGATAKKAGGVIHSDFEEKFIKAQVVDWQNLVKFGSLKSVGEHGLIKIKGESYPIEDGQIVNFQHG